MSLVRSLTPSEPDDNDHRRSADESSGEESENDHVDNLFGLENDRDTKAADTISKINQARRRPITSSSGFIKKKNNFFFWLY